MTSTAASPICFGDVVKLYTKPDTDSSSMGFLEHKNDELLLVMGPVKESVKDKYQEAEFIVAPIRCEKPPTTGTPLKYKQSFVLMTSSKFEEYSLNNKMQAEDTIGLQCRDVKGEMYVAFEKEGYTIEANVMDGDVSLDLVVVDSNRMRKKYNKKLSLHTKSKALALGGYVTCGAKGKPMSLRIAKVPGATETTPFAQKKIVRRRSTLTKEMLKADELARANRVGSDASEAGGHTPTSSATTPVAVNSATTQENFTPAIITGAPTATGVTEAAPVEGSDVTTVVATTVVPAEHSAPVSSHEPSSTTASTAESTASTAESTVTAVAAATTISTTTMTTVTPTPEVATPTEAPIVPAVELFVGVTLKDKTESSTAVASHEMAAAAALPLVDQALVAEAAAVPVPVAAKEAGAPASSKTTGAGTANATPSSSPGATPQAAERSIPHSPTTKLGEQQASSLSVTSEAEGGEEKVDSACLGGNQCAIM